MTLLAELKLTTVDDVMRFAKLAANQEGDILVKHNNYIVDGSSILGILSLNLSEPVTVEMIEKKENEAINFFNDLMESGIKITRMEG